MKQSEVKFYLLNVEYKYSNILFNLTNLIQLE